MIRLLKRLHKFWRLPNYRRRQRELYTHEFSSAVTSLSIFTTVMVNEPVVARLLLRKGFYVYYYTGYCPSRSFLYRVCMFPINSRHYRNHDFKPSNYQRIVSTTKEAIPAVG